MPTDSPIAERTGTCLPIASTRSSLSAVTLTSSRPISPTERTARQSGPRSTSSSTTSMSNTTSPSSRMKPSFSTCGRHSSSEYALFVVRKSVLVTNVTSRPGNHARDRVANHVLEVAGADHELVEAAAQQARDRPAQDRHATDGQAASSGVSSECGRSRVAQPAARMTAFMEAGRVCNQCASTDFRHLSTRTCSTFTRSATGAPSIRQIPVTSSVRSAIATAGVARGDVHVEACRVSTAGDLDAIVLADDPLVARADRRDSPRASAPCGSRARVGATRVLVIDGAGDARRAREPGATAGPRRCS